MFFIYHFCMRIDCLYIAQPHLFKHKVTVEREAACRNSVLMAISWVQQSCACTPSCPCSPQRTAAFSVHPDSALNTINVVFTYWQSQGKELFLPLAWLLKIKAENSNLKRQLKETRKFSCITQQLFLSLSKFPSTLTLSFPGFLQ